MKISKPRKLNPYQKMTTDYWLALYRNWSLRQHFVDISKGFTKQIEFQEDLMQDAWLRIGECPADKTLEYYKDQGFKAMNAAYQREWKQWRLVQGVRDYSHRNVRWRLYEARKKNEIHANRNR